MNDQWRKWLDQQDPEGTDRELRDAVEEGMDAFQAVLRKRAQLARVEGDASWKPPTYLLLRRDAPEWPPSADDLAELEDGWLDGPSAFYVILDHTRRPYTDLEMQQKRAIAAYQETNADLIRTVADLRAILRLPLDNPVRITPGEPLARCLFCRSDEMDWGAAVDESALPVVHKPGCPVLRTDGLMGVEGDTAK